MKLVDLNEGQRETVNSLVRKYKVGILLAVKDGKIELLRDHWQYLDTREAKRIFVFRHSSVKTGLYYITHEL